MRVTVLIENRPSKADTNLVSEWGLSLHVAFSGRSILFDTGLSGSFAGNAERLSVDISSVDAAVLSHHHFDHGGGLRRFLEVNSRAKVYLGETPDGDCFIKAFGVLKKYVGLDKGLAADHAGRLCIVGEPTEILPDVFLFPRIKGNHPRPLGNKHLYLKRGGHFTQDDFAHEIVLAIKEEGKLVIFTGCSHSGILNMIESVGRELGGMPIKAAIGGFHLVASPPFNFMAGKKREIEELARKVLDYPVEMVYTGHCTGTKAFPILKAVMKDRLRDMATGSCFEV